VTVSPKASNRLGSAKASSKDSRKASRKDSSYLSLAMLSQTDNSQHLSLVTPGRKDSSRISRVPLSYQKNLSSHCP